jgi:hypothetical protein
MLTGAANAPPANCVVPTLPAVRFAPLRLVSPAPLPVKLAALMVPALKFPLPSRLTRVPTVLRLVAVSPSVTAPLTVVAVMSALPVTETTPPLPVALRVSEPPSATVPPPLKPVPALTVMELLANWLLPKVPLNWPAGRVPARLVAVSARIA